MFNNRPTMDQMSKLRAKIIRNSGEPGKLSFCSELPRESLVSPLAYHEMMRHGTKLTAEKPKKLRRQEDRIPVHSRGKPCPTEAQILAMDSGSHNPWDEIAVNYSLPEPDGSATTGVLISWLIPGSVGILSWERIP